ncbi:nuclear transport factor 2 family protein [Niabella aurantiaca]|uniref:nuclear transport factor 2 family protein n=1 Tax=Niabella aurantiaca TaxID=379900 RepID=UPI0003A4D59A|nr:nuclear transport factor 2 family protein [Niabella aurantiaca]
MNNREIVQDVIHAFLNGNIEQALAQRSEEVQVGWPGFLELPAGKEAVRNFFRNMPELVSGRITGLISEGNKVAGTGTITGKDKEGTFRNSFFCDVYELENGKPVRLQNYMVFEQLQETAVY